MYPIHKSPGFRLPNTVLGTGSIRFGGLSFETRLILFILRIIMPTSLDDEVVGDNPLPGATNMIRRVFECKLVAAYLSLQPSGT